MIQFPTPTPGSTPPRRPRSSASASPARPLRSGAAIPSEAELLSPAQAACVLGISERHLRELAQRGAVPVLRLGRSPRIPRVWIEAEIERTMREWRERQGAEARGASVVRRGRKRRS